MFPHRGHCIGIALQIRDGLIHPTAIAYLTVAVVACAAGLIKLPGRQWQTRLPIIAGFGVGLQLIMHFCYRPPQTWSEGHSTLPYYLLLGIGTVAMLGICLCPPHSGRLFAIALTAFAGLGTWLLIAGPKPRMDVWMAQTAGLNAAVHGHDPWNQVFPIFTAQPALLRPWHRARRSRRISDFPIRRLRC